VDKQHSEGRTVTNFKTRNFIRITYEIEVTQRSIRRYFKIIGLSWKKVKKKKRTLDGYRVDAIREYIIKLNKLVVEMAKDDNTRVAVCTDESYVHNNHSAGMSYFRNDDLNGRSTSKGNLLIILHAITPDAPLCMRDPITDVPYDDLEWTGDTPHPKPFEKREADEPLTCELLWVSSSSTGDYHDNMNSEMCIKWVKEKLVPTFEKMYPGKTMVLIQDNAPYHHKRGIPSLAGLTKKRLLELAVEHGVDYIDLPMSMERRNSDLGQDAGEYFRVELNVDTMGGIAGRNRPNVPNVAELRLGIVKWFQDNRPDLLECQVEKYLKGRGHEVLWTPPYCPDLQPIELFWAAGKNHAAWMHFDGRKMKDVVSHLRAGWYGNKHLFAGLGRDPDRRDCVGDDENHPFKEGVSCQKLWLAMIKKADEVFIKMCPGLSGTIGSLVDDGLYQPQAVNVPIDAFLNIHAGLHGDEGVLNEDGEVIDPFGGDGDQPAEAWV
jgi:hypothetical protein